MIRRSDEQTRVRSAASIVEQAARYVLAWFNKRHDARLVYHNYQRTQEVVQQLEDLAQQWTQADQASKETALLAAWFHLTGHSVDYGRPYETAAGVANEFLTEQSYPADRSKRVLEAIRSLEGEASLRSVEAQLLHDAVRSTAMTDTFFQTRPLLRLEWELVENRRLSPFDWNQLQMQDLLATRFYSPVAKSQYEQIVAQNLLTQREKTEKSRNKVMVAGQTPAAPTRRFQDLERKVPVSATQTFFRTNYRNHINLSAIADNKANILISVNAILISVVISILSYRDIPQTNPMVLMPIVIFLVTGLSSLICAVLSIRPKVTAVNNDKPTFDKAKKNVVFFGNFIGLDLEQFEDALDAVLRDGELLYGNMARDLYYLGQVLDKKYRYLTMAYNIFMVGFIATVLTFLIATFT